MRMDIPYIVEEVPGVPDNEKWFVDDGNPWKGWFREYPHFETLAEAECYCFDHGIVNYEIEFYEG